MIHIYIKLIVQLYIKITKIIRKIYNRHEIQKYTNNDNQKTWLFLFKSLQKKMYLYLKTRIQITQIREPR